ncbi:sensor domain-containing diguanylate cyclase [Novosphingobium sp.]|uniref:sensor domain-containing diguanylate cyclase n=1 Tax=Novosphingobium sp. TaxID=1874826 RepID=UPI003D0B903A
MATPFFRILLALIAIVAPAAISQVARAEPAQAVRVCHAGAALTETYAQIAQDTARWTCGPTNWSILPPRTILRFELPGTGTPPTLLITRLTRFSAMRLTVIGRDGRSVSRDVTQSSMVPGTADWVMSTQLPQAPVPARTVIVQIDNPRHVGMLSDARLGPASAGQGGTLTDELALAALCGMLAMPLLFNFMFYRVLRRPFLLWHAATALFMAATTLVTSGVINRFAALSLTTLCVLSVYTWASGMVTAAFFSADLIEEGMIDVHHRRLLRLTGVWIPLWSTFYLFADGPLRAWATPLYFMSFLPVFGVFAWVMTVARLRGSRAINFQIAAWAPMLITGLIRVATGMGATAAPLELQFEQHLSIALEVIITSLGVADRFLLLKRERDEAKAEAHRHRQEADHDPLTGLLNRRGLEQRFAMLLASGFSAMAIIDLDLFKMVNDTHGHATGDDVLRAVAHVLAADDQTLAVRWGGEEFLLLLAGTDIAARAERRRLAIPVRVATDVPSLNRLVTASMGLVERIPRDGSDLSFSDLYNHCDRLLYEAKLRGRNRTRYGLAGQLALKPAITAKA